jgi:predicted PurR-regulated permease PerM
MVVGYRNDNLMNSEPQPLSSPGSPSSPIEKLILPAQSTDRMSIDVRGWALGIGTTVIVVFALQWAKVFVIPLLLGIIIAYTLNPLVAWLERIKIPRMAGTTIIMMVVLSGGGFATISLGGQLQTIIDQLPTGVDKLSLMVRTLRDGQPDLMQKVQTAAHEIGKGTSKPADIPSPNKKSATQIIVDPPMFNLGDVLMAGSVGVFGLMSESVVVLMLVFFLLLTGDTFKRKLVRLTGSSLSEKKITVHILDDINISIQRYMFTLFVANVLLALLTWTAFRWIGLDNAGGWAIAAGVLNVVPYLGPAVIAIATGIAGFMQFDSFWMAVLVSGSSVAIATFIGIFVITWMTGQVAKLNAVAVFISILFWGWLWGVAGLLLAIPILGIVKVVSEHIKELHPVAELLKT